MQQSLKRRNQLQRRADQAQPVALIEADCQPGTGRRRGRLLAEDHGVSGEDGLGNVSRGRQDPAGGEEIGEDTTHENAGGDGIAALTTPGVARAFELVADGEAAFFLEPRRPIVLNNDADRGYFLRGKLEEPDSVSFVQGDGGESVVERDPDCVSRRAIWLWRRI